jgi:hypothetical protein
MVDFYSSPAWKQARAIVLARDGYRCTVVEPDDLGVDRRCRETTDLHVHDLTGDDPHTLDPSKLTTTCASHHALWHALWRGQSRLLRPVPGRRKRRVRSPA